MPFGVSAESFYFCCIAVIIFFSVSVARQICMAKCMLFIIVFIIITSSSVSSMHDQLSDTIPACLTVKRSLFVVTIFFCVVSASFSWLVFLFDPFVIPYTICHLAFYVYDQNIFCTTVCPVSY